MLICDMRGALHACVGGMRHAIRVDMYGYTSVCSVCGCSINARHFARSFATFHASKPLESHIHNITYTQFNHKKKIPFDGMQHTACVGWHGSCAGVENST